jgi:hypothetical protein
LAEKSSWDRQSDGKSLVWFGEIERKLAKLSITIPLLTVLPLNYFMIAPVLLDEEVRGGVEHQELEEEDDQAQGQTCVGQ